MIQQITAFSPEETAILEQSWRGRQMLAYQQAYGGGYDFCRFSGQRAAAAQAGCFCLTPHC